MTEMFLQMRFGEAVKVSYVDLANGESRERFADLVAMIGERGLTYPLVTIDGEVKLAGSAHYYHVLPYVEEKLTQEALAA